MSESDQDTSPTGSRGRASIGRLLEAFHVDLIPADPQPSWIRWAVASVIAVVGSLAVDAALVAVGKSVFPQTAGFKHFQFAEYAKLTVVGVVIACAAWPVVTRISSWPRWLFLRMAVLVTLVLLLPDVYLWAKRESTDGILVLVVMHLAIALVTYNSLVRIASAGDGMTTEPDAPRND